MNIKKCENGHFYNADKYEKCPHCAKDSAIVTPSKIGPKPIVESHDDDVSTTGIFDIASGSTTDDRPVTQKPNSGISTVDITDSDSEPETDIQNTLDAVGSSGKTIGFFGMKKGSDNNEEKRIRPINEPVVGWLVCIKGYHLGESFTIVTGQNSIGRNSSNKIAISDDDSVSREKHAWITYEPVNRCFYIRPGEGSGIAYVNKEAIMESRKLKAFDKIEFSPNGTYIIVPLCGENFSWEDYLSE